MNRFLLLFATLMAMFVVGCRNENPAPTPEQPKGDFVIDGKYTFEVGGASKDGKQIAGAINAYIAADNIEYALGNKIPLWLFGFLY